MNYVLCILNKEKQNITSYNEDNNITHSKIFQIDLAIKILSDENNLSFDSKLSNFNKMKDLLERFISENMLSVYGEELAEDLLERISSH